MKIDLLSYKPHATIARLLVLAVISFLILVLFAWSVSPFYEIRQCDATIFKMMGMAWREGYIPYRDFFDHKGPLHYAIQLLSFSISNGKVGLLLFETLNAVVIFELLYRCGKELGAKTWLNLLSLFVSMNLFAVLICAGNTVEEWSLPYQLIPLLLAIKYLQGRFASANKLALICGLCFGATAMIRVNDNCIICGIVIGLSIVLLANKAYKELGACIGYFLVGMIATILPFVVYFYLNDALSDMIYCNLTFNIHYKSSSKFSSDIIQPFTALQLVQCLILPFTSWWYDRSHHTRLFPMMTAMSLLSFYVFIYSAGFEHYFLMVMPLAALCVLTCSGKNVILPILISMILLSPIANIDYRRKYTSVLLPRPIWTREVAKANKSILSRIPKHEQDSIYAFNCLADLINANTLPIGKYTFMQDVLCNVDTVVYRDIQYCFYKSNPKWIISYVQIDEMKPIRNINHRYELVCHGDNYYLYRRKN